MDPKRLKEIAKEKSAEFNVDMDALHANLIQAFTLDTEAAMNADRLGAEKQPKLLRPTAIAIMTRAMFLLPPIPPIVVYKAHGKLHMNVFH